MIIEIAINNIHRFIEMIAIEMIGIFNTIGANDLAFLDANFFANTVNIIGRDDTVFAAINYKARGRARRKEGKIICCLLYTSPSPRDRG